jgi:branched-chain amino acid transport system permease protein
MDYLINVLTVIFMYGAVGQTLNWLLGYASLFSVAQGAVLGIGAFAAAIVETRLGIGIVPAILIGAAVAACTGSLVGLASVRVGGSYLIIASFGLQEIMSNVFTSAQGLTGGATGLVVTQTFNIGPLDPATAGLIVMAAVCAIFCLITWRLGKYGSRWRSANLLRAIREDELGLWSCGWNVNTIKVVVNALSFAGAGLVGAIYGQVLQFVSPEDFDISISVLVLSVVAIGGLANPLGPIVGAVITVGIPQILTFVPIQSSIASPLQDIFYGVLLVLFMRYRRNGILGVAYRPRQRSPDTPRPPEPSSPADGLAVTVSPATTPDSDNGSQKSSE